MTDPAATLKTGEQLPKLDETHAANRLNSLFGPEMQPVETKRIRKLKFAYPSGAQPLSGYTIKRGIGIGGFGEVYFALSDAGKEVALKRIQRNLDIELRGVRQCLNLKHINLIRLWDICTSDEGESWVVMEYVPGDSLRDIVEANPNGMPMDLVHQWFLSTAAGVAYLHSRGIVHRDLKPGNIFYDQDEQIIKIGDYGLSKFISCSRRSGQTESVGTFHYMAPEIGKGVYGKEIDIYALGIILFEIMTGNVPFDGESSQEIIMKHLTADPDVSKLPQLYGDIVRKAMHKDPEQRYRCVSEMVEDFPDDFKPADRIGPTPVSLTQSIVRNGSATSSPINLPGQGNHQGNGVDNRERFVDDATNGRNGNLNETRVPPIQPLIIDDNEIIFGDVREFVPAEQKEVVRNDNLDVEVEHVEIVAADTGVSLISSPSDEHPEEPIAKAVTNGWSKFKTWWHSGKMNTPLKFFLVFIAAVVLIKNSEWILPSALGLGLMYLMYYAVRTWSLKPSKVKAEKNEAKPKVDLSSKYRPLSAREAAKQTTTAIRHSLSQRTAPDRITELLGSMLVSAAIGLIIGMLGYAVATFSDESGLKIGSMIAWATAVSILSSWFLLLFGKFFEPTEGDAVLRRVSMLGVGILVGIAAASIGYMLELPYATSSDTSDSQLPLIADHLYFDQGGSAWAAYVISFACLFAILRWWRQTDPVRKTRLSLVGTGICIIWATIFGSLFGIDLIWICVVAGVTAIITQLAAPWIHPKQRIQWIESRLDDNSMTQVPATS